MNEKQEAERRAIDRAVGRPERRATDDRIDNFIRWSTVIFALLVVVVLANAIATATLLYSNQERVDDVSDVVIALQAERVANIRRSCLELNDRNVDTRREVAQQISNPASRKVTLALVDRLVPVRNCQRLIAEQAPSATETGEAP